MTKSIEQTALEAANEMCAAHKEIQYAITLPVAIEFLRRCLAKIGEGLEPVAKLHCTDEGYVYARFIEGSMNRNGLDFTAPRPLYATPHEAIIAAEQLVAEACAKLVEKQADVGIALHQISIRSGEWRKYK